MYETNDWYFGEDYLKDFENINTSIDEDDRSDLKKRKLENESLSSNILNSENCINDSVINNQSESNINDNKINKRNKILKIFNISDGATRKSTESYSINSKDKELKHLQKSQSQSLNRRQKIAELFKNTNLKNNIHDEEIINHNSTSDKKNNIIPSISANISRPYSENLVFEPKPGTSNNSENWLSPVQKNVYDTKFSTPKSQNKSKFEVSKSDDRRALVLDCFKKSSDTILSKRTLVRKFPGPAGLLPEESKDLPIQIEVMDNNSSDEDTTVTFNSTTYCSQRTKNLFTEGAWQLMVEDLPDNFLNGFDIASIKQKAKLKKFQNNKVPFMAGIVQSIDYTSNNPKIVLKDLSGEIECYLHCKIINKYPNVLDYGVVILLRDIGLIVSNVYLYAMVSQNSLVSIYTHKERVISTSNLKIIQSWGLKDNLDVSFEYDKNVSKEKEFIIVNKSSQNNERKKDASKVCEIPGKTDPFKLFDNFFEEDIDFDKENVDKVISNSLSISSQFEQNSQSNINLNKDSCVPVSSLNNINSNSSSISKDMNISKLMNNTSEDKLEKLFDMDDEAFFTVDEHISQVEQSFFASSSTTNHKTPLKKCSNSCENENDIKHSMKSTAHKIIKNEERNKSIADLKKYSFQRKIPSAILNTTSNSSLTTKAVISNKLITNTTEKLKDKIVVESTSSINVNSALFKLQQFKRQVDEVLPEKSLLKTKSQCNSLNDDLFSCDDDVLMSQIELDSLET